MAMVHFETKPISRSSGRSSTASSAYRAGIKLEDNRTGLTHDFSKKSGVMAKECFIFSNGKRIEVNRSELWNTVEQTEKRKDARTAREFILNLPHELNEEQRKNLTDDFGNYLSEKFNVAIDYAIHAPNPKGDDRNFHAHVMVTTRTAQLENNKIILGDKTPLELSNKKLKELELPSTFEQIKELRKAWTDCTNHHLQQAGLDITLDHRSFKEQGKDQQPTIKLGWYQSMLERKGVQTKAGDYNRQVKEHNAQLEQTQSELDNLHQQQAEKNKQREQEQKAYWEQIKAESDELEQRKQFEQRERKPMFNEVSNAIEKLLENNVIKINGDGSAHYKFNAPSRYIAGMLEIWGDKFRYEKSNHCLGNELVKIYDKYLPKCKDQSRKYEGHNIGFGDDMKLMPDGRVGVLASDNTYKFYRACDVLEITNLKNKDFLNEQIGFCIKGSERKFRHSSAQCGFINSIVRNSYFDAPPTDNAPTPIPTQTQAKTYDRDNDFGLGF